MGECLVPRVASIPRENVTTLRGRVNGLNGPLCEERRHRGLPGGRSGENSQVRGVQTEGRRAHRPVSWQGHGSHRPHGGPGLRSRTRFPRNIDDGRTQRSTGPRTPGGTATDRGVGPRDAERPGTRARHLWADAPRGATPPHRLRRTPRRMPGRLVGRARTAGRPQGRKEGGPGCQERGLRSPNTREVQARSGAGLLSAGGPPTSRAPPVLAGGPRFPYARRRAPRAPAATRPRGCPSRRRAGAPR